MEGFSQMKRKYFLMFFLKGFPFYPVIREKAEIKEAKF